MNKGFENKLKYEIEKEENDILKNKLNDAYEEINISR